MQEQATTFSNDQLQVKLERLPACIVKFDVQISPLAANASHLKAYKNVSKEVVLPGFRKGKAPEGLIRKQFAPQIDKEYRSILLQNTFFDVINLTHIRPYNKNDYKLKVQSLETNDQGAHLIYQFEAYPETPDIHPSEFVIPAINPQPVSQEDIDEVINNIRLQGATWKEIDDRAVEATDHVTVDIEVLDEPPAKICDNSRFDVSDKSLQGWLRHALIGMRKDENKEIAPEEDPEAPQGEWSHKKHRIHVKKIEMAELPPIDDALAKKSGVDSVDLLNDAIRKQLEIRREDDSKEHQRMHMKELLVTKFPLDLPQTLTSQVKNIAQQLSRSSEADPEMKNRKQEIEHFLLRDACLALLVNKVAAEHKIEISEEELRIGSIRLWMKHIVQNQGQSNEAELRRLQEDAPQQLLREKVLDFLISQAKPGEPCHENHLTQT